MPGNRPSRTRVTPECAQVKAWFEAPYLFMATDPSGSDVGTLNPSGFNTAEVLRDLDRPLVASVPPIQT